MAKFLQYRDGGKTDEKGISTHLAGLFQGEVINGLAVTQDSPLGMSVLVSKGRCMIDSADDYPYLGFTDANEVVTITAADGSNPRIDAIVAYVDLSVVDSTNANNPGAFEIVAVAGTPAGSPSAPNDGAISTAIGLGNPFIRLAHVTVGTGVTTITTGNVSDQRVFVGLPDGFIRSSDTLGQSVVTPEKWTNPYKFSVYRNGAQSLGASGTTKIQFETEEFDTSSNYDSSTNFRFIAPVAGYYQFNAQIAVNATSADSYGIELWRNGSVYKRGGRSATSSVPVHFNVSSLVYLDVNEYVEIYGFSSRAATTPLAVAASQNWFNGYLVSLT